MATIWSFAGGMAKGGAMLCALGIGLTVLGGGYALAQSSGTRPQIEIHPRKPNVIELPVIPQGSYLDPGPGGPAIRPDVKLGDDRNEDYVFPPNLGGFDGGSPPGDPTSGGGWSPLPGDTPSF